MCGGFCPRTLNYNVLLWVFSLPLALEYKHIWRYHLNLSFKWSHGLSAGFFVNASIISLLNWKVHNFPFALALLGYVPLGPIYTCLFSGCGAYE